MTGKPKTIRFWQEIALALVLKAVVLAAIWLAWFSNPEEKSMDASKLSSRLFSQQPR